MSENYFVGVDVGTGSVRAGLVSSDGRVVKHHIRTIKTWTPQSDFYEQSSEDIWNTCIDCMKEVISNIDPKKINGIGFDATCSLVCLDHAGRPLSVSPTGSNDQNIILWMDHRAKLEAEEINRKGHDILKYVGGKISLEMETPKLLWLKRNLNAECWEKAGLFFDLPDFLTWKATGSETRSLCSLVCKWNYEVTSSGKHGWNSSFFQQISLEDLCENNWKKIGSSVQAPGSALGNGLCKQVAEILGLIPNTPVGVSMIDAHAGGLGLIGCSTDTHEQQFSSTLSLICGTSTCHMAVSEDPIFTPGVWGPYFSAMVPGMWLNEGGQSATGKLIDHIIETHPAYQRIKNEIGEKHVQVYLTEKLNELTNERNLISPCYLTEDVHVWPDFHGNRSPLADPTLKGSIVGLTLTKNEEDLAILYLATIQALAYGTRHILESLKDSGYKNINNISICGGLSKNSLFVQTQADVVNLPVLCPDEPESVLVGAAILGASASEFHGNIKDSITKMGGRGKIIKPNENVIEYHNRKYNVFLSMYEDQMKYRRIMKL